jgi:hypothetical protein
VAGHISISPTAPGSSRQKPNRFLKTRVGPVITPTLPLIMCLHSFTPFLERLQPSESSDKRIRSSFSNLTLKTSHSILMMQKQIRLNLLKLAAIVLLATLVAALHVQMNAAAQDQPGRLFEIAGMTMPLEQRIGSDDGAAFVVHFSGDTRGVLEACG